jgi:sugar/nucleoside kinase (ribokinase family)
MEKAFDVLHIGIMCADIPLKIPYDTVDFTVDSIILDDARMGPGGDAANAAQVMARLGKKSALLAKIGDDAFGHIIKKIVEESGADTSFVKMDPVSKTPVSVVLINKKGDRSFLMIPGSIREFSVEDVDADALRKARHVNFSSFFAHPEMDRGGAGEIFKLARSFGATTSADVTHDIYGSGFAGIRESLRCVDYFMPSYAEGKYLTGETEPERIADFIIRETGDKTVVIKMGEEGCFVKSRGKCFRSRPYKTTAVDTTGAGDNFVAGFLTGLTNGWEIERCADFANAVAGFSVRHIGATAPEMGMECVLEFIKSTPLKTAPM